MCRWHVKPRDLNLSSKLMEGVAIVTEALPLFTQLIFMVIHHSRY